MALSQRRDATFETVPIAANVAWPIDHNRPIIIQRKRLVAVEPSARGGGVTESGLVFIRACGADGGDACSKRGSRADRITAHDDGGAQAMGKDALWIIDQNPLNLRGEISAMGKKEFERMLTSSQRICIGFVARRPARIGSYLLRRAVETERRRYLQRGTGLQPSRTNRAVNARASIWLAR